MTKTTSKGLKVYTEICSACHGLKYVPIRTLGDEGGLGYSEDQVRAYAENYEIFDPELDDYDLQNRQITSLKLLMLVLLTCL